MRENLLKTVLFNIHDVTLLLIAGECSMLALFFLLHRGSKPVSHLLLSAFLLLNALVALHTLIVWGDAVRFWVFELSPYIFFTFSFAFFLQGPVLYWYTRSLIYKDFRFVATDWLHLIPTLLTPVYLYFVYYRYSVDVKSHLALESGIYQFPSYNWFVHMQKTVVVVYGVMCLFKLHQYRNLLKHNYSNIEKIDFNWLLLLIGGFLIAWLWILFTHLVGFFHFPQLGDVLGIVGNYLIFALINALIFYSLTYSGLFEGISSATSEPDDSDTREAVNLEHVESVRQTMLAEKLFLNSRLTLEEFARHTGLSPRQVSSAINRCLNQNFHEFVNIHRVEEAKLLLRQSDADTHTVIEVATLSGFNSKAAFNRLFKKYTGMTPTQYRGKWLDQKIKPVVPGATPTQETDQ